MFEGFSPRRINTSGAEINLVVGGNGPPLLLLHGYPQTHVMWHKIAPGLKGKFTVVVPDLRGYGDSSKPSAGQDHYGYSKRAMAEDQIEVMSALGYHSFFLAGHDRGARVAYRLTLDHPERIKKLAVLDIIPTWEQFNQVDKGGAMGSFHWYFLAQPVGFPERLIGGDPEFFFRYMMENWCGMQGAIAPEAMAEYLRCFKNPETIHATCEDYRAGATLDFQHDEEDRKHNVRISCPLLVLWGDRGKPHKRRNVLDIWRNWAVAVEGRGLPCGHFIPEEAPEETLRELLAFFNE